MKDFETGSSILPNESNYGLIIIGVTEAAEMVLLSAV
jgi:hypothetical protein